MIQLHLQQFEGPLSLLLYLIRKEEMDIFDINIQEITHQYLEYIRQMKELDLELAGDFIAMASTLLQIKSRMLLPQYDENGDVVESEDPRKELVQRLLEYQKYQEASKMLQERPWIGRDLFLRGSREDFSSHDEPVIELDEKGLFGLISSYHRLMKVAKKRIHNVSAKVQSIASRILEIRDLLLPGKRATLFELITATEDRGRQLLITFLSLLELGKLGFVKLYQSQNYSDIHIDTQKPIESEVISNVEEYDNIHSEDAAEKMFSKAQNEIAKEKEAAEVSQSSEALDLAESESAPTPDPGGDGQEDLEESLFASEDDEDNEFEKEFFLAEEIATDEDILQAEKDLERDHEHES
jgi:segregation and condensation protein A